MALHQWIHMYRHMHIHIHTHCLCHRRCQHAYAIGDADMPMPSTMPICLCRRGCRYAYAVGDAEMPMPSHARMRARAHARAHTHARTFRSFATSCSVRPLYAPQSNRYAGGPPRRPWPDSPKRPPIAVIDTYVMV